MSEFLREKQRDDEIAEEQNRQYQRNRRNQIHRRLPQSLAGLDVKKRQAEENRREQQHDQVLHRFARSSNVRHLLEIRRSLEPAPAINFATLPAPIEYPRDFLNKA
ncbi:MAG: hypothetical protein WBE76_13155 [Terracidiphilus sp.]